MTPLMGCAIALGLLVLLVAEAVTVGALMLCAYRAGEKAALHTLTDQQRRILWGRETT